MKNIIDKYFPKTKALIENENNKPTQEERLAALEELFLEQILMGGMLND